MKNSVLLLASICILFSSDIDSQWTQTSAGMHDLRVYSIAANQSYIFAGTYQSLSVSSNNGANWSMVSFNSQLEPVMSITVNNSTVFCGVKYYGVTVSPNNGGYWTFHHPLGDRTIYSLTYTSDGKLFAAASGLISGGGVSGVYLSNDNGYSFTETSLMNKTVFSLTSMNNEIFAGTQNDGVYRSTNNGVSWIQTALNSPTVKSLAVNNGIVFAGTQGNGVYLSSNSGASWIQTSLNNGEVLSLAAAGNLIFAGLSFPSNFYVSSNNGSSWELKNEGLGNVTVDAVCTANGFIFAGTTNSGIYRRPLGELTGIEQMSGEIPTHFSLSQNYPNPFNPSTTINFSIPQLHLPLKWGDKEGVILEIYDVIGNEITTLVNQPLTPGIYSVVWDASNHPSGIYFYRLTSGNFSQTNKMILLK